MLSLNSIIGSLPTRDVTLRRPSAPNFTSGYLDSVSYTDTTIAVIVQEKSPSTRQQQLDGYHTSKFLDIRSSVQLKKSDEHSQVLADRIVYNSIVWEVINVWDWFDISGFYVVHALTLEVQS